MDKTNVMLLRDGLGELSNAAINIAYMSDYDQQAEIAERFRPLVKDLVSAYVDSMSIDELKKSIEYLAYDYLHAWLPSNNDLYASKDCN